ncbi:hypothetical protein LVO79_02860 [Roseivivax marinus]|uniref:hypothetical protein n=1 Tax=Roseivivax marinus TaxID=1379903 RepID=UPI0008B886BB|nr:hypothetical protein [Roseivivax marinus]UMA65420.1 hypothetical protein LVO79_02860 [Roseivivax marinus]SEL79596.1 hypothetical protein SAMN05444413_11686 [Roseivivax marinus]
MTALDEYQRLEATGLWRPETGAQRREVVVALGNATLTIKDMQDRVLAHWSLAAITRATSAGHDPALYHPDGDPEETLELSNAEADAMIEALERILRAVDRRRPRPGKLRVWLSGSIAAVVIFLAVFWLPGALIAYATHIVPAVKRAEIGTALTERITRVTGQPCSAQEARQPLRRLAERVLGEGRRDALVVLPQGLTDTAHLPGGRILLSRSLIEDPEDPDVPAGFVLAEAVRAAQTDPLEDLLRHAGLGASLQLLTTGELPKGALDDYAESLLTGARAEPVAHDTLLAAFSRAELRSEPYAYWLDVTGESTLPLIEADPRRASGSRQVLTDADWVRLQSICGG